MSAGEEGFLARWSRRKRAAAAPEAAEAAAATGRRDAVPAAGRPNPGAATVVPGPGATAVPNPGTAMAVPAPGTAAMPPGLGAVAAPGAGEGGVPPGAYAGAALPEAGARAASPMAKARVGQPAAEAAAAPAFDPASLPAINDLTEHSDIAVFLRPGVPASLRQAALRRAWSLDPAIRDFVGPADYAWDYNAPDGGVFGFSPTLVGNIEELLAQAIGAPRAEAGEAPARAVVAGGPGEVLSGTGPEGTGEALPVPPGDAPPGPLGAPEAAAPGGAAPDAASAGWGGDAGPALRLSVATPAEPVPPAAVSLPPAVVAPPVPAATPARPRHGGAVPA
ncbi:DUF3306 domain-containing protein [Roseomonas sp. BN140053]|uniref:DUF3306 domain-containing protein n=1 Tax=Roseomonas sp. BN140053 TaxID=3391898 RepID=UPI0039EABE48